MIIVDGTRLYSGGRRINDCCLEAHHNRGTEEETVHAVSSKCSEAKIYLGNGIVCNIMSEFIENSLKNQENWQRMSGKIILPHT